LARQDKRGDHPVNKAMLEKIESTHVTDRARNVLLAGLLDAV
jgi:hypothetical protein